MNETPLNIDGTPYTTTTLPATLEVEFSVSETVLDGELQYRLIAEVTTAVNIEPQIFVYQRIPDAATRTPGKDAFVTVATPVDMSNLPVDYPTADTDYYCRKSIMDIVTRSPSDLETWKNDVLARIRKLCAGMESVARVKKDSKVRFEFVVADEASIPGSLPG